MKNKYFLAQSVRGKWRSRYRSKLKFRGSVSDLSRRHCGSDFTILPIGLEDVLAVESLPLIHRDPFDRLLVAQAQRKDLEIILADKVFDAYGVKRLG